VVRRVRSNGEIKWQGGFVYISTAIIADRIGLIEVDEDVFEVRFYQQSIGRIEKGCEKLKPIPSTQKKGQFQPKL
jgi:hypothetical protein